MSARAWQRRRMWKRLNAVLQRVWRDPSRMERIDLDGKPIVVLGSEHPLYEYVVEK